MSSIDLGLCCACDGAENVRTAVLLPLRLDEDMLGDSLGWGCVQCELPLDGALAAICDSCAESDDPEIKYVSLGGKMMGRRVKLEFIPDVAFGHDLSKHPELFPANNLHADIFWFEDSPDAGDPSCLCSYCGDRIMEDGNLLRAWGDDGGQTEVRFHVDCLKLYELLG